MINYFEQHIERPTKELLRMVDGGTTINVTQVEDEAEYVAVRGDDGTVFLRYKPF